MNFKETMELFREGQAHIARRDGRVPTQLLPEISSETNGPDFDDLVVSHMRAGRGQAEGAADLGDLVMARRKARREGVEGEDFTDGVVLHMLEQRAPVGDLGERVMAFRRSRRGDVEGTGEFEDEERFVARFERSDEFLVGPGLGSELREASATAEQMTKFAEYRAAESYRRTRAKEDGTPLALSVAGDQARVSVRGLLSEVPDLWAWILGSANTLYSDVADAIHFAERDPKVRHVTFDIESGGGTVSGIRTATQAIRGMKKSRSVVSSFAASAAYWLAAEVGRIEAKHDLAQFGSVGAAVRVGKFPHIHDIASKNAPNKRPDPSTAEGKAAIQSELDAIHEKFAADVAAGRSRATGRSLSIETVNDTFGRGGMLLAEEALKRGMIDAIR